MDNYILDDLKHYTIDHLLYKSGNKIVDDFIKYTQSELFIQSTQSKLEFNMMMEFVPYNQFEDIEFIAEGGFSKVYKATWINGHIQRWNKEEINFKWRSRSTVAFKKLNNSKNITSKELNEIYNLIII